MLTPITSVISPAEDRDAWKQRRRRDRKPGKKQTDSDAHPSEKKSDHLDLTA